MKADVDGKQTAVRGAALRKAMALAIVGVLIAPSATRAQAPSERPTPPGEIPGVAAPPSPAAPGAAINVPPPASAPPAAAPTTAPLVSTVPEQTPMSLSPNAPAQGVLALSARYGKDLPVINGGLVWRVYSDRPDETGAFKLLREERTPTPNIPLPPGNYVVHVAFGLVSDSRQVTVKTEVDRQNFVLPAGALRIEGRVGSSKIASNHISFSIYRGSQFEGNEQPPILPNVAAGDFAPLPEGMYYIVSTYGDANSIVRSDIRVQSGKLTDTTITHRAAVMTLKLVSEKGGEALANTAWSIMTPGGDVIKEAVGAFPSVVLSEGEYRTIAKNDGRVYERTFKVVNGVDSEIEVITR